MNTHKILLGALLIKPDLAPYSLPELEIEYFPADLQPVFAALSGFWNATGKLDAVGRVKYDRVAQRAHDRQGAHIDDKIVIAKAKAALC